MSVIKKDEITTYILDLLVQLASDWDYEEEISPASYLFGELGFQSLDAVILGNSIQEHYGCVIPYPDLFAEIGQRETNDITVHEWIEYTAKYVKQTQAGMSK